MNNEYKEISCELKALNSDGTFEGYASTFGNIDSYDDTVEAGAFAKSIAEKTPALLWQHKADEVIGTIIEMKEDEVGLFVKGRLLVDAIQRAKEVYELLKAKAIKSMSIGYRANAYEFRKSPKAHYGDEIRVLKEIDLLDISLVTFPADKHAKVMSVKSYAQMDIREIEDALRDAGFSRKEAKTLISRCKELCVTQRDETEEQTALKKLLEVMKNGN